MVKYKYEYKISTDGETTEETYTAAARIGTVS